MTNRKFSWCLTAALALITTEAESARTSVASFRSTTTAANPI